MYSHIVVYLVEIYKEFFYNIFQSSTKEKSFL